MNGRFTEFTVEQAALAWLENTGQTIAHRPDGAPDMRAAAQTDCGEVSQKW